MQPTQTAAVASDSSATRRFTGTAALVPGLVVCAVGVGLAEMIGLVVPTVSVMMIAIVLGMLLRNTTALPATLEPGFGFAAKRLLRAGIVLLGLQLVVGDVVDLGFGMLAVVVAIVSIGIVGTVLMSRWIGLSYSQGLLIACGFSICGAAAVAATDGVIETKDEEEVVTAIALVVIFGTVMIPLIPAASTLLGLTNRQSGLWAGGAIHEVAQAVAAGGAIGGAALGLAVVMKLARVLMLAPVMTIISLQRRRQIKRIDSGENASQQLPPFVPFFVAGFIAMVALRSLELLPAPVIEVTQTVQTLLLATAMFALGAGVRLSIFRKVGLRPFVLAAAATALVIATALLGVVLFG
ncbi:YeiH family protein (plasmid) [Coraliomargarita sp. W4R53]